MRRLSARGDARGGMRVLPITLVLLVDRVSQLGFGAFCRCLCGALTDRRLARNMAAVNRIWPASLIVVSIVSMVGLGIEHRLCAPHREPLPGWARGGIVAAGGGDQAARARRPHRAGVGLGGRHRVRRDAAGAGERGEVHRHGRTHRDHRRRAGREHACCRSCSPGSARGSTSRRLGCGASRRPADQLAALGELGVAPSDWRSGRRGPTARTPCGAGGAPAHRSAARPVAARERGLGARAARDRRRGPRQLRRDRPGDSRSSARGPRSRKNPAGAPPRSSSGYFARDRTDSARLGHHHREHRAARGA